MNRLYKWGTVAAGAIAGFGMTAYCFADALFTVPTSTVSSMTANVSSQFGDLGTLAVVALAAGIPLFFYIVHALIGLVPKSRARRT